MAVVEYFVVVAAVAVVALVVEHLELDRLVKEHFLEDLLGLAATESD